VDWQSGKITSITIDLQKKQIRLKVDRQALILEPKPSQKRCLLFSYLLAYATKHSPLGDDIVGLTKNWLVHLDNQIPGGLLSIWGFADGRHFNQVWGRNLRRAETWMPRTKQGKDRDWIDSGDGLLKRLFISMPLRSSEKEVITRRIAVDKNEYRRRLSEDIDPDDITLIPPAGSFERLKAQLSTVSPRMTPPEVPRSGLRASASDKADDLGLFTGRYAWLGRYAYPFTSRVKQWAHGFRGRRHVFKAINSFLRERRASSGYFLIQGDPGIGKTALLAHLVQKRSLPIHHFNISGQSINSPRAFLRNICARLIAHFGLAYDELPEGFWRDGGFLNALLEEASAKLGDQKLLIIIDALDEVDMSEHDGKANVLFLPYHLPRNVYVIATTKDKEVPFPAETWRSFPLEALSKENLDDIRNNVLFRSTKGKIRTWLRNRNLSREHFSAVLSEKSEGCFLYVSCVLDEISDGDYDGHSLDELPTGLKTYYKDKCVRMGMTGSPLPRKMLRIIYTLSVVPFPVSRGLLSQLTEASTSSVQQVLNDWRHFLNARRVGAEHRYNFCYESFREFLHEGGIAERAGVSVSEVKGAVADKLWKGCDGPSGSLADQLSRMSEEIRQLVLGALPRLLTEGDRWKRLVSLLTNFEFIEAKAAAGMIDELRADYAIALTAMLGGKPPGRTKEQEEELSGYTKQLVAYAAAWTDARDRLASGETSELADAELPPLPDPPESVRPLSEEELKAEDERLAENPSDCDRVQAFSKFVAMNASPLAFHGTVQGFTLQQAYAASVSALVSGPAEELLRQTRPMPMILPMRPSSRPAGVSSAVALSLTSRWPFGRSTGDCMASSADTRTALTGGPDGALRIWNLDDGGYVEILPTRSGDVCSVAMSSDGRQGISGNSEGSLCTWNLDTGELIRDWPAHQESRMWHVVTTPDGTVAMSVGSDRTPKVWDLRNGQLLQSLPHSKEGPPWPLAMSSNAALGLTGYFADTDAATDLRGRLDAWDLHTTRHIERMAPSGSVTALAMTQDGARILVGTMSGHVGRFEVGRHLPVWEEQAHWGRVKGIAVTADGRMAVSGGQDGKLCFWDVNEGRCLRRATTDRWANNSVSVSADGKYVVTYGGSIGTLSLWDVSALGPADEPPHKCAVKRVSQRRSGTFAITCDELGEKCCWDTARPSQLHHLRRDDSRCSRILVGEDSTREAHDVRSKDILIWRGDRHIPDESIHEDDDATSGRLVNGNEYLVTASDSGRIRLHDIDTRDVLFSRQAHRDTAEITSMTPDGRGILARGEPNVYRLIDLSTGECLRLFLNVSLAYPIGMLPDGRRLLMPDRRPSLLCWDIVGHYLVASLSGKVGHCWEHAMLTNNGRRLVTVGGRDDRGKITVWDLKTWRACRTIPSPESTAQYSCRMSGDGRFVLMWCTNSLNRKQANSVWLVDLENGRTVAAYADASRISAVSSSICRGECVIGTERGHVRFLELKDVPIGPPVVTAGYMWRFRSGERDSSWSRLPETTCPWCGGRIVPSRRTRDTVGGIARSVELYANGGTYLDLPKEAWEEEGLKSACPKCSKAVQFNPFLIDTREMYSQRASAVMPSSNVLHGEWLCPSRNEKHLVAFKANGHRPPLLLANRQQVCPECFLSWANAVVAHGAPSHTDPCVVCSRDYSIETPMGWICTHCARNMLEIIMEARGAMPRCVDEFRRVLGPEGTLPQRLMALWAVHQELESSPKAIPLSVRLQIVEHLGYLRVHPLASEVRESAVLCCQRMGPEIVDDLFACRGDGPWQLVANTIEVASAIAGENPRFRSLLKEACGHPERWVKWHIVRVIEDNDQPWTRDILMTLKHSSDERVSKDALRVLGKWDPQLA